MSDILQGNDIEFPTDDRFHNHVIHTVPLLLVDPCKIWTHAIEEAIGHHENLTFSSCNTTSVSMLNELASALFFTHNAPTHENVDQLSLNASKESKRPICVASIVCRPKNFNKKFVLVMKRWGFAHLRSPYPNDADIIRFSKELQITPKQVKTWFCNFRKRSLKPLTTKNKPNQPPPKF
jgi:hypothetical protein